MPEATKPSHIRNVAIIAHVDHGKTSLVDKLLLQSGQFRSGELEKLQGGQHGLIMDSNPLERERGITIFSKNCAVWYTPLTGPDLEPVLVNIIDTPGHSDFGGEVERVMRMADGVLLLVDAYDGPMPQTRFVLTKALEAGLTPIVVINKCDRPDARPAAVHEEVFNLFIELGRDDIALDFPCVYSSGREGWATLDLANKTTDLRAVFEAIVKHVPSPKDDPGSPLQLLVTTLDYSDYVGRIGIGRVFGGSIKPGQQVASIKRDGKIVNSKVGKLYRFQGLGRIETDEVHAGDLCAVVGLNTVDIGDTICDPARPAALPPVTVDEPTVTMVFRVNDGPFGGQEGQFVTSRQIRDRLEREMQTNVAMRIGVGRSAEEMAVSGRGLLHLGILVETMRREGFELTVGKPEVITKEIDGVVCEPVETLVVDVPTSHVGPVMELVATRRGELVSMDQRTDTMTHLSFTIPSRGLIGLRSRLLTSTQGEAIMHHSYLKHSPAHGETQHRIQGVLVATEGGDVTTHACTLLADRGVLFVVPGEKIYPGQIVGEHNRDNDLPVNITRLKALTNMRVSSKEATVVLKGARKLSLEQALEYIEDDELVEITPSIVRLRKKILDEGMRKRSERQAKDKAAAGVEA